MSQKKSELYYEEWKSRISQAEAARKKVEGVWEKHVNYYRNKMWESKDEVLNADLATVNQIYPLASIILETTFNQNPKIYVRPTRPEFTLAAEVLEFLVNHVWYDLKICK